jgi:GNAT superfamily N-acetyltransferase
MTVDAIRAEVQDIQAFRALYLQETNCQIRYNACHERGWTDSYLLKADDLTVGYGSVKGREIPDRDTVFEFFVIRPFRKLSGLLFGQLVRVSGAGYIECQSNDLLLSGLLSECARDITSDTVLFEDHAVTGQAVAGATVRRRRDTDRVFTHSVEPVGDYVVLLAGEVVGTGGFFLHYNAPFADVYMEIREDCRRRGLGRFLVQEVKKECYLAGRVPAARCAIENTASRATLTSAGLSVCGYMLAGRIRQA